MASGLRRPRLTCDGADHHEEEKAGRPEEEGEDQRRNDEEMRDALGARRAHFPGADEEVEGEIVQPAGEQQARRLEKQADVVERREAALGAGPEGCDQPCIGDRQERWNGEAGDAARSPMPGPAAGSGPAQPSSASMFAAEKIRSRLIVASYLDSD